MSRYCWESGTLKVPTKEWKPFRDGLTKAWNERQAAAFKLVEQVHARLLAAKKASARGKFDAKATLTQLLQHPAGSAVIMKEAERLGLDDDDIGKAVLKKAVDDAGRITGYTLKSPLKKDFAAIPSSKATHFVAGYEGDIHLDAKAHTVTWSVDENNHAVEHARDSYMGSVFFKLLNKITWGRGSGGEIVGNDEYNRDDRESGGGANYVTGEYGYAAQKRKEEAARAAQRSASYPSYGVRPGTYGNGRRFR